MAGLFASGPALAALHEDYAKRGRIDEDAPVRSSSSVLIAAPPQRVWEVVADIRGWAAWAPAFTLLEFAELAPDARFRWKLGGVTIDARFAVVDPVRELSWTGRFLAYKAVDRHLLAPEGDGTRFTITESLNGPLLPLLYGPGRLRANHDAWLHRLKAAVERG